MNEPEKGIRISETRSSSIGRVVRNARLGAAAVEFAVIAPLFFLLLGGIIEFGTAFRVQHSLSVAARQGARAAIVEGKTSSQITQKLRDSCVKSMNVAPSDVIVAITVNGQSNVDISQSTEGDEIGVTVSIPYSKAYWHAWLVFRLAGPGPAGWAES